MAVAITSSLLVGTAINQMAARDMVESILFRSAEPSFARRFIETVLILFSGTPRYAACDHPLYIQPCPAVLGLPCSGLVVASPTSVSE